MKQFKNKSFVLLLYAIAEWCFSNKQIPRKIDIWIEEPGQEYTSNVYYYPSGNIGSRKNIDSTQQVEIKNPTTEFLKTVIPSESLTGLTDAEIAYKEHLKREHKDIE
jgi:hypothetical protein